MHCTSPQACKKERTAWRQNLGRQRRWSRGCRCRRCRRGPPGWCYRAHQRHCRAAGKKQNCGENQRVVPECMAKKKKKKIYRMRFAQRKLDKLESLYFLWTKLVDGSVRFGAAGSLPGAIRAGWARVSPLRRLGRAVRQQRVRALPERPRRQKCRDSRQCSIPSSSVVVTCSPSPSRARPGVTGTGGLRTSWGTAGKAPLSGLPPPARLRVF